MAILLPVVRLSLLTSNIWITYKRLKRTRPPRNGERNSRYLQARKRDLRNLLQVWMLWGIGSAIEPLFDRCISFLPFYTHTKTLLWFILLVTRSIVAEPVYIHFLRPFVKPYVVTIDLLLDLIHAVGELILEATLIPLHYLRRLWRFWRSPSDESAADSDSLGHETPLEQANRPVTRSQIRDAEGIEASINVTRQSTTRQTRSQTVIRKKPSMQTARTLRSNTTDEAPYTRNSAVQQAGSRLTFVDPRTLNLEEEPHRVRLRKQRSSLMEIDPNTPPDSGTAVRDDSNSSKEKGKFLDVPPLPALRSHSDSAVPVTIPSPEGAESSPSWSGLYPPLPAAYPASPLLPRPTSLPSFHPPEPTYTVPGEPYPAFPSAYPVTPATRPLSLHPNFSVGGSGHLFASMVAQVENLIEEQETDRAEQEKEEIEPVLTSSGVVEQSVPNAQVTVASLRRALAPIGEKAVPKRVRNTSTSEGLSSKAAGSSETRRVVSGTMTAAMRLAPSNEQDQATTQALATSGAGNQPFRTKSHVPQKRPIRGEASSAPRGGRETTSRQASTSKANNQAAINPDDGDVSIKRRKVSREASNDSRRTSRESSLDRNANTLARTRRRAQPANAEERVNRESRKGRPAEGAPGSDYPSRASTLSTGSRRTRATASGSASASEAYQTSRRRAT